MQFADNVEYWRKSDYCWVEVNLATLTWWGCYQILNTGVSLSVSSVTQERCRTIMAWLYVMAERE